MAKIKIATKKYMLQIARIIVTRPKSRRLRKSAQLVGAVVGVAEDVMVDEAMDAMADAKVNTRSGEMITRTGI